MKCKFCGAEIKEGSRVCEYCDSEVEGTVGVQTIAEDVRNTPKGCLCVIGKIVIALACIWGIVVVISMVVVFNSDAFKNTSQYLEEANDTNELPKNEEGLKGQINHCNEKGIASIMYEGQTFEGVEILDKDLIGWLNSTERSIDWVEICFATDEKGDISLLGLLSPDFFIVEKKGDRYTAVRDAHVFSFTSSMTLETEHYYSGYFFYPDIHLYWGEEKSLPFMTYMDPKCDEKESTTEQDYYTGEDISVYKVLVEGKWCYCTKETYDMISVGDLLNEYEICENQGMKFIVRK